MITYKIRCKAKSNSQKHSLLKVATDLLIQYVLICESVAVVLCELTKMKKLLHSIALRLVFTYNFKINAPKGGRLRLME